MMLLFVVHRIQGDLLDKIKDGLEDTKDAIEDTIDDSSNALTETINKVCMMDEGCNTSFLNINNYCCGIQCCNMFEYVYRNENYWDNLMHTFQSPRAINIIIVVAILLTIASFIGIVVKLVCCLCCGCCGSKKYVIVGS